MLFNSLLNIFNIFLGFLNLKVLFDILNPKVLDEFFIIQAIALSVSSIFTVSFEVVFQNFIPKWQNENDRILLFKSILITSSFYVIFLFLNFKIILLLPYAIMPLFSNFLYSKKRYALSNLINSLSLISIITAFIILKPRSLNHVLEIYFIVYLIVLIILIFVTKPKIAFKNDIFLEIKNYFKLSFISSLTSPLYRYLDRFVLGLLGDVGDVSGIVLIRRIDSTIRQILNAPLSIAAVEMSSDILYLKKFFPKYTLIAFGLFLLEIVFGYFAIILVAGSSFLKFYPSLIIFSIAFLISSFVSIFIIKKRVQNNPKPFLINNVLFVICYFIFSIILFEKFKEHAIALSFLISTIIAGYIALKVN